MKLRTPRYCQGFVDRHGHARWYFRRPGFPRAVLPGLPWSPEFMAAYEKAKEGERSIGKSKTVPGSVSALVASYYETPDYKGLSVTTKATYRGIIERFRAEHGDKRVAKIQREHIKHLVAAKSETPMAANNLLRMVRMLMKHAMDTDLRRDDPTAGIRRIKNRSQGFQTWEEEHIAAFEQHHKRGTRAHLAMSLLLHTGQRRSDVIRMGRQHIRNGVMMVTQQKTGADVGIPVHADLQAAIAHAPKDNLTFLVTAQGAAFTPAGFTNWFRDMVKEAGLPDGLSPHGLRKAICRRLAEAGCTPHEIMAISGHKTLKEVTRYTVAANRQRLAQRAMGALGKAKSGTEIVKPAMQG